ncbi:hypothetical protein C5Y96_03185 [Blastopirellula marina]|uniref:Uncharacterized protein n=1 Tax=Blastopirellula marina TaxID=124 RepID=A0A2S8G3L9_9BACT|nr:hypothetical protein C5Y96_03185 [Blastopirellula marina]RCS55198.1 hypothetical protein DTL36_03190 [Bremerella cremea]
MEIQDIQPGRSLHRLEPSNLASVPAVTSDRDCALQVPSRAAGGSVNERLPTTANETDISITTADSPCSFAANGCIFKPAVEAKRIDLSFVFDPLKAAHRSNVESLSHQITVVP